LRPCDKLMLKLTSLLLLISCLASAQKSILYNKHRQLIVDTSFTVDEHTYKNLPKIEGEVLPVIYDNIKLSWFTDYPEKSSLVIVKLAFNNGICTYEVVRAKHQPFDAAVFMACKVAKREYESLNRGRKEDYLVYIPVKFELAPDNFNRLLKRNKAITIQREQYGGHRFADTIITH